MIKIKGFFQGTEYHTPVRRIGWISRLLPTLTFYIRAIMIVVKGSFAAKQGNYDSTDWHNSSAAIADALEKTGCHFEITGMENLQGIERPCIFIGNHMSTLETFVLPSLIMPHGQDLSYVIKRSLVEYPFFGNIVKSRDPVVVDRVNPRDDLKVVMEEGAKRLEQGRSLIIFPQSTRTVNFDPKQFNSIGIKLAQRAGALVIPVALLTWAWSSGKLLKDFGPVIPSRKIHFAFGAPMEVTGKGQEQQAAIVSFIEEHLEKWRSEAGA